MQRLLRGALGLVTAVGTLVVASLPAAGETDRSAESEAPDEVVFRIRQESGRPSAEARVRRRRTTKKPPERYIQVAEIRFDPASGQQCVRFYYVEGDADGFEAVVNDVRVNKLTPCPAGSTPVATPAEAALDVWRRLVRLPTPVAEIDPGWAITGKPAYLEIEGNRTLAGDFIGLGHQVTIRARSVYDVDWGDGTVDRGIESQGGPYPNGDVQHVYDNVGTFTVTVTQRWTADWSIGTQTGTIDGQLFTVAEFQLPVRQVQAVRER